MSRIRCRPPIPDSTYATKGGTPARLGYYDNYLVDNHSCVIVGVQATAARMSQETVAAQDMLTRFAQWQGREPASVAADATYGNGEFLQWLLDRGITPYMRTRDSALRKNSPVLWSGAIYISARKQQLSLSRRGATELCRPECSQSCPCLHRQRQTLRSMLAKSAMHELDDINISPSTCMSRPGNAHGSWRTHRSFPMHNGNGRRSRRCLRN